MFALLSYILVTPYFFLQQILYEELVQAKEALGGKEFDAETLSQLPYLDAVIKGATFYTFLII